MMGAAPPRPSRRKAEGASATQPHDPRRWPAHRQAYRERLSHLAKSQRYPPRKNPQKHQKNKLDMRKKKGEGPAELPIIPTNSLADRHLKNTKKTKKKQKTETKNQKKVSIQVGRGTVLQTPPGGHQFR